MLFIIINYYYYSYYYYYNIKTYICPSIELVLNMYTLNRTMDIIFVVFFSHTLPKPPIS